MGRNMIVAVLDPDGTERAVHRIQYGARLQGRRRRSRSSAASASPSGIPYTRPILTEVEGTIAFEDLVEGQSMTETLDESTGIAKRVVIDWRTGSARGQQDLRPAIVIKGKDGKTAQARARRRCPLPARGRRHHLGRSGRAQVKAGDVHRAYPDRERQDARHHRRSAAGGGAVRGAPAEGIARSSPRSPARCGSASDYKNKRRITIEPSEKDVEPRGVPDPEGQAHPPAGRRRHREGRLHRRRQPGAARHPGDQGRRGACRLPRQRDPGGLPAAGRARSTTSTSR